MDKYMDYIQNLPASMQFILALITVLGTSGFIAGFFSVWKIYATSSEQNQRIKTLELDKMRVETEGKQTEAMNANMKNLIDVIAASNDRWQNVFDKKSERQLEADKLQHETNKLFAEAMKENTGAIRNLTEMIEIQSEHYQGFSDSVDGMRGKLDSTLQTVEGLARDNRTDYQNMLGNTVKHQTTIEDTLRSIYTSIHNLRTDVTNIVSQNEQQKTQTLQAIDAKISLIERNISSLIAPQAPTQPLPVTDVTPETTETEDKKSA